MIKILNFYQKLNFALNFIFKKNFNELELIKKHIKSSSIVFDVGSNLGNYIKFLSTKLDNFDLEIHSFEPIDSLCKIQKKLKLNSNHKLKINNLAILNCNKKIKFYENNIASQSSTKIGNNKIGKIVNSYEVQSVKLDKYYIDNSLNQIGFMKIDVEGAELSALESGKDLLNNKKINLLKVEISNSENNLYDVINYMKKFDYKIVSIDNLFFKNNDLNLLEVYFEKN